MVEAPKIGFEADALKSIREPLISLSPVKYLPSRMIENDPEAYAYSLRIPPNTPVMLGNPTSQEHSGSRSKKVQVLLAPFT